MKPQNNSLIDVASGTGDLAKLFIEGSGHQNKMCVEPNIHMLNTGK